MGSRLVGSDSGQDALGTVPRSLGCVPRDGSRTEVLVSSALKDATRFR